MNTRHVLYPAENRRGSVMVAAVLILTVVTVIGIAAITTSMNERQASTNFMLYERAFYTADAGLEHVKEVLRNGLREPARMARLASGLPPDWTFILDGDSLSSPPKAAATGTDYAHGIRWIVNQPLGDYTYTVTIWDNQDDLDPAKDTDGIIFVRSEATGPQNSRCSIETSLNANAITNPITGYSAQEGSGSGKTFISNDRNAIDFNSPGFAVQLKSNG